ncbi:MAG TPA: type II secretion system protein GspJ [Verrucomicrobiae bacterium]
MKIEINNKSAFTLVEMIIAIGVASLVLIAVNTVLFSALHLREATLDMVDAETPVDATMSTIRRDLQCCVTPTNGTAGLLSGDFRAGNISSSGISEPVAVEMFTATGGLSDSVPWGDIQRVTYELKNSTDPSAVGRDLYRTVMRNLLPVSTVGLNNQLMLTGVASVKFSCYDGAQWNDTWDTTSLTSINTNLPMAVRVDIQMAGNPNAQPVEIIVPIDAKTQGQSNLVTTASN